MRPAAPSASSAATSCAPSRRPTRSSRYSGPSRGSKSSKSMPKRRAVARSSPSEKWMCSRSKGLGDSKPVRSMVRESISRTLPPSIGPSQITASSTREQASIGSSTIENIMKSCEVSMSNWKGPAVLRVQRSTDTPVDGRFISAPALRRPHRSSMSLRSRRGSMRCVREGAASAEAVESARILMHFPGQSPGGNPGPAAARGVSFRLPRSARGYCACSPSSLVIAW